MKYMKRREAVELGLDEYCTGKPCKRGHLGPRYARTGGCKECNIQASKTRHKEKYVSMDMGLRGKWARTIKETPRKIAAKNGEAFYQRGTPCKKCGTDKWYTCNARCHRCQVEYARSDETLKRQRKRQRKAYAADMSDPSKSERKRKNVRRAQRKLRSAVKGRLCKRMSSMIKRGLKDGKQSISWREMVDYSVEDLKNHIEKGFEDGMTWGAFMRGDIHIDHIRPIASFSFDSVHDEQFKECWGISNLQPLWWQDNLKKGSKMLGCK